MKTEDLIRKFKTQKVGTEYAYKMGYDCGKNGSNETNCSFTIFSTPENTKAWERGKRRAESEKSQPEIKDHCYENR